MANATKNPTAVSIICEKIDTLESEMIELIGKEDWAGLARLRDGILKIRTLIGSGGKFETTNGATVDSGRKNGLTGTFDEKLAALIAAGVVETNDSGEPIVNTIIKRGKQGRPRKEVVVDTSLDF